MIRIGEFSCLAKTTVKTLRFYDEIGLFKPVFVDENGYRYYKTEQLDALQRIIELRNLNIPIDEIKIVLNGGDFTCMLKKRLAELRLEREENEKNIKLIKNYIAKAEKGEKMEKYKAIEKVLSKEIVYYRHGIIPTMADIVGFILGAGEECLKNNPNLKCKNYCYITYGADEYQEKNVELEYVEAVEEMGKESENIKFKIIPQVDAVCVEHIGSYATLSEAYAYALGAVREKGYEICGKIREVYIHGCWDKENESEYLTEIQIPIKK